MSSKRWSPRGKGFVNIFDRGRTAMWLRPAGEKLDCVVYVDTNRYPSPVIWTLQCDYGAKILESIYDKPWRVAMAEKPDPDRYWGAEIISKRVIKDEKMRRAPKVRSYVNPWKRRISYPNNDFIPRKFQRQPKAGRRR